MVRPSKLRRLGAIVLLGAGSTALVRGGAAPETAVFRSPASQTALIELYTSEGCSSCPPADRWLQGLSGTEGLWRDFVPVAFHVDYWDELGWPDVLASPEFSERQRRYAADWRSRSIYTPGFVLNGREWRAGWSRQPPPASDAMAGVLVARRTSAERFEVEFLPPVAEAFDVYAALLGCGIVSQIRAGENHGRRLEHEFAALDLETAPLRPEGEALAAALELRSRTGIPVRRLAVAFWVTRRGQLSPVQATGGFLD
jgi:hypothetical protein